MEPVVSAVDRDEVGGGVMADEEAVKPEDEVHDAAVEQVVPGLAVAAGNEDAGNAEEQVDDVVEYGDLEDAQEERFGAVPGERQSFVVAGDAWDEAEDSYQQEDGTYCLGCFLKVRFGSGGPVRCGLGLVPTSLWRDWGGSWGWKAPEAAPGRRYGRTGSGGVLSSASLRARICCSS